MPLQIWEVSQKTRKLLEENEIVNHETGEITYPDNIVDELIKLEGDRDKALLSLANWYKNQSAILQGIEERIEGLKRKKKSCEKTLNYIKDTIDKNCPKHLSSKLKITDGESSIYYSMSESVEIDEGGNLPEEYKRKKTVVTIEPDKNRIKEDLKRGVEVPGASLRQNLNLQIK